MRHASTKSKHPSYLLVLFYHRFRFMICQRYQLLIVMGYYALRILPFCSPCCFFFTPFQLDNICRAVFNLAWPLVDPSPLLCFLGRACARAPGPCGYSLLCSRGKITTFEVNCALLLQNRARAPLYAWISHIPNSEREFLLFETHTCVSLVCICVCVCVCVCVFFVCLTVIFCIINLWLSAYVSV